MGYTRPVHDALSKQITNAAELPATPFVVLQVAHEPDGSIVFRLNDGRWIVLADRCAWDVTLGLHWNSNDLALLAKAGVISAEELAEQDEKTIIDMKELGRKYGGLY